MADADNAGSVSSIEADIERTRERLAANIDQLLYRASPKTIVGRQRDQVRAFFVDEQGAPRQDNLIKVGAGVLGVVALVVVLRTIVRD